MKKDADAIGENAIALNVNAIGVKYARDSHHNEIHILANVSNHADKFIPHQYCKEILLITSTILLVIKRKLFI